MKVFGMVYIGDSRGRVWPEPMQNKSTKSSWWKSAKIYVFSNSKELSKWNCSALLA